MGKSNSLIIHTISYPCMHTDLWLKSINPQIGEHDEVERMQGWEAGDKDIAPPLLTSTSTVASGKSLCVSGH